jgi:hypothetical protein
MGMRNLLRILAASTPRSVRSRRVQRVLALATTLR